MRFTKGDFVKNPKAPQWGVGEVQNSGGEYVYVIFEGAEEQKMFNRADDLLQKVNRPEGLSRIRERQKKVKHRGKSFEERIKRDEKNARHAKDIANMELGSFSRRIETPDITRGPSASYLESLHYGDRAHASLQAVCRDPFHVMLEVTTGTSERNKKIVMDQLWYANEQSMCNLPLWKGDQKINVLAWTHPGVQLALVGELG